MSKVSAIIVAAGKGKRFGAAKQFSLLKGKTVLDWSLSQFEAHEAIDSVGSPGLAGCDGRVRYEEPGHRKGASHRNAERRPDSREYVLEG